jgi:lysophospholipase L1-like esterase
MTGRPVVGAALVLAALAAACGGSDDNGAGGRTTDSTPHSTSAPLSPTPAPSTLPTSAPSTPKLDSIVALGHSGTTGYGSDPADPNGDVRENSWATGANPRVNSVYQRLLATHPALKGHGTSLGVDGSNVDGLPGQVDQLLALTPLPDVVIIQSIDNDMQCDGTDPTNEKTFATKLDKVLTTINAKDQNAQIFFVTPLGSVQTYTDATKDLPAAVSGASGTGPCDTFTPAGKERPAGIASEQKIIKGYFDAIKRVCAAHRACFTDGGALLRMPVRPSDVTADANHLSVQGHAVMAQYAWNALPAAIKTRA